MLPEFSYRTLSGPHITTFTISYFVGSVTFLLILNFHCFSFPVDVAYASNISILFVQTWSAISAHILNTH